MGSHVPTFGHDIVAMASGTRAHERCMLSRDIATGASKLVAALWVARFAYGRTATLTYSAEPVKPLAVSEVAPGVYAHFGINALIVSTSAIVLAPGAFWIAMPSAARLSNQAPTRMFCTALTTSPTSLSRTGAPLR